jgi:hypothetical protein
MHSDGVAIFFRDDESGEERPVEFVWGTGAESLAEAWNGAVAKLSARDSAELRSDGFYARFVSLAPLPGDEIDESEFIESCLRHVDVKIEKAECTSHAGNQMVTEVLLEARLSSDTIRVPITRDQPALPEFTANYVEELDEGVVELEVSFTLQSRTASHAIYRVEDLDNQALPFTKGRMAPSSRTLFDDRAARKHG